MIVPIPLYRMQQQILFFALAVAAGAACYFRNAGRKTYQHGAWSRLDRHAPLQDELEDGSFPASDPPSSAMHFAEGR